MKFTQFEIVELKNICVEVNVPMSFQLDGESIDIDYSNNKSIHSILKRVENGYSFNATNSNGSNYHSVVGEFDVFKMKVSNWIKAIKRDNPYEVERKSNINNLSPKFYSVFQEAYIIDELGFHESSGMIYRKSLEIVVKDFLILILPVFKKMILQMTIGHIVLHFYRIDNEELVLKQKPEFINVIEELNTIRLLVKTIRNTFNIGNDFSHYERKLLDFTSNDMRINIQRIANFIDYLLEEKKLQSQRKELDNEFNIEKLI